MFDTGNKCILTEEKALLNCSKSQRVKVEVCRILRVLVSREYKFYNILMQLINMFSLVYK